MFRYGYNPKSSWWHHAVIGNYMERAFQPIVNYLRPIQTSMEQKTWLAEEELETRAASLIQQGQSAEAYDLLDRYATEHCNAEMAAMKEAFAVIVTRFRDGYDFTPEALSKPDLNPNKLFYPKWWLEAVGFFNNPPACMFLALE